ncbi:YraN family protein [Candidatus Odyssella thessalonicensis]|uniref:YraN family protein n=1 Tax=Candidatus Odyssella thessalonicensis TaxID=84647 RepID=UPI000225C1E0|nr:YraN family protein [Candidatus Odyssella thessalonicensis]
MKWTSYSKGIWAEYLASLCLMVKGYSIQARRYRTPWGEIDLIAKRGKTLTFVEVKRRQFYRQGLDSISLTQRNRIERSGQAYMASVKINFDIIRFDVMIVTPWRLYHLKDAWRQT